MSAEKKAVKKTPKASRKKSKIAKKKSISVAVAYGKEHDDLAKERAQLATLKKALGDVQKAVAAVGAQVASKAKNAKLFARLTQKRADALKSLSPLVADGAKSFGLSKLADLEASAKKDLDGKELTAFNADAGETVAQITAASKKRLDRIKAIKAKVDGSKPASKTGGLLPTAQWLAMRWVNAIYDPKVEFKAIEKYVAKDATYSNAVAPQVKDMKSAFGFVANAVLKSFPDFKVEVDKSFGDETQAVVIFTSTGTFKADIGEVKATNKAFKIQEVCTFTAKDKKLTSLTMVVNGIGLNTQIGAQLFK